MTACSAMSVGIALAAPAHAGAHGLQGRADVPIPLAAFYWAAALVLVISFGVLARAWHTPRLAPPRSPAAACTAASRTWHARVAGAASFVMLVMLIGAAALGTTEAAQNIAPLVVFVCWWIGIALVAGFVGDAWRAAHPVAWLARALRIPDTDTAWARRRGVWPAVVGIALFAWLELVVPTAAHVRVLAALMIGWVVVTFVGTSRWGIERWLDHGEPFAVYTRVLSRMAPRHAGTWMLPLRGLATFDARQSGMVTFVTLLIGSVSFDGISRSPWWKQHALRATARVAERGISADVAHYLVATLGLITVVATVFVTWSGAAAAARYLGRLPRMSQFGSVSQAFVPSLVPIALAYVVAHYFSYVWFQSQWLIALLSDPLGRGWDIFGTRGFQPDFTGLSATAIWIVQVTAIVVGHIAALVVAHDRAVEYRSTYPATRVIRSQLPMLMVMVMYTVGGLYALSEGLNV